MKLKLALRVVSLLAFTFAITSVAQAQIVRSFVSGVGVDTNSCNRNAPCRTFQRGHDVVFAGGEVVALDSAGYGRLTITKSVTISGEGIRAAVTATTGQTAVMITAPGATVVLREITITGDSVANVGVQVTDAANVFIERSVVAEFNASGIVYQTNNRLIITDSVVRNNGQEGLFVNTPSGGTARVTVDKSRFLRNAGSGISMIGNAGNADLTVTKSIMSENGQSGLVLGATGTARAQVADSTAAHNGGSGFVATTGDELNIEYSVANANSDFGMENSVGGTIRVSNSVSTDNRIGFSNTGGVFESRGNNTVRGNTQANTVGVITIIAGT